MQENVRLSVNAEEDMQIFLRVKVVVGSLVMARNRKTLVTRITVEPNMIWVEAYEWQHKVSNLGAKITDTLRSLLGTRWSNLSREGAFSMTRFPSWSSSLRNC
jgi:hypothetical protein